MTKSADKLSEKQLLNNIHSQNKIIIKQNKMIISLLSEKGIKDAKPVSKGTQRALDKVKKELENRK